MKTTVTVHWTPPASPRVLNTSAMFDVPPGEKLALTWHVDLPVEARPWQVGLITGPSGAGKTQIARALWPGQLTGHHEWPAGVPLVDAFPPQLGIRAIAAALTAAGLNSIPAWLRPHETLSGGEQFRADMAYTLATAEPGDTAVVDEFTSYVDRQVAQVASHAVQKTIRRTPGAKFVAVTCHADVTDWLQPDWTYDVAAGRFAWRSVQPHPPVRVQITPVTPAVWPRFARHHYLTAKLHPMARCFGGWVSGELIAFTSYLHFGHPTARDIKLGHRLVVLPDYQGLGIGGALDDWLGEWLHGQGYRYRNVLSHPALIAYYERSPRWRETRLRPARLTTAAAGDIRTRNTKFEAGRESHIARQTEVRRLATRAFEYVPQTPPRRPRRAL